MKRRISCYTRPQLFSVARFIPLTSYRSMSYFSSTMYKEESFPTQTIPPNNSGVTPWGVFPEKKIEGNPISAQIVEDIRKDRGFADAAINNVIEGKSDESINRGYQLFDESIQRDRGPIEQKEEGRDISMGESSWRNDSSGKGNMNRKMGEAPFEGFRGSNQSSNMDESIRRDRGPTEHKVEGRDTNRGSNMGESSWRTESSSGKGSMNSNKGEASFKRNESSGKGSMNSNMGEASFKRNESSSGNQSSNMDESIRRDRGPTEHKVEGRDTNRGSKKDEGSWNRKDKM